MIIPLENKLVRLYIQPNEVSSARQQGDRSKITPEIILKAAQKSISSYELVIVWPLLGLVNTLVGLAS